jgi:diguanylate cyclase (GGDEF)-like protein
MMIDIDRFKVYNDTYGHEAGDAVLSELGRFLQKAFRGSDTPCRYGGEEFAVILPGASLENAIQKAGYLRDSVKELGVHYRGRSIGGITLTLGVASFPDHGVTGGALLRSADHALYQAKKAGRDRVVSAGTLSELQEPGKTQETKGEGSDFRDR